jgi:hypothetical protein
MLQEQASEMFEDWRFSLLLLACIALVPLRSQRMPLLFN